MSEAFLKVVNMSISAGWLVLAVLALRLILKKAPKWVNVLLWGIVAVRLICPFSIESALSLIPSKETISPEIMMDWTPEISTGIEQLDQVVNPVISTSFAPQGMASANPLQILIPVAANLWLLGVLILLIYTAISYLSLRHKLRTAVILRDNIFQCETVSSPFVLGILKPKIYLPYSMDGNNLNHVVAHEQAHIKRKDHWWKPLGFLLLTVYWFNPLMWLAYILLCRDIELACDEKVIAELGNEQRADYTQALVTCSVNRRMIAACPLAFGEVDVKERVKSVMNYKKPAFRIVVVAVIACVVVAVCFLTDPETNPENLPTVEQVYLAISTKGKDFGVGLKGQPRESIVDYWGEPDNSAVDSSSDAWILNGLGEVIVYYDQSNHVADVEVRISDESTPDRITFEAEVLEFYDGYILVKPEPSWAFNSVDRIEVPLMNVDPALEPQVGDIIEVSYSGEILETYPARLKEVYSIRVIAETTKLTLNDVIILSQYGYDLSWSDFDDFDYIETGSGLYIRVYEINDLFHLAIGGAGPNSEPMYMHLGANGDDADAYIDIRDGGVTEFISEHNAATVNFTGNLNLGLNAEIVEIDYDNHILYVKDIYKSAAVFGDRCAIDCKYAISRYNLLYVNYGNPNDVRTIDFSTFEVGDAIIIGMYESEKEKAFNGSAIAEQVQLGTQRLNYKYVLSYEPLGVSGDNVKELSTPPDDVIWQDGFAINELAPGEEIVSDYEIIIDEDGTDLFLTLSWGRAALVLKYGIRAADGTEYFQEKPGGYSHLRIKDLPAGTYHLFVRNSDAYHGIPAYENPEDFPDVSFNATGAILYAFDN